MYEQYRLKELRGAYSCQGWVILIYYGILNMAVSAVMVVNAFAHSLAMALSGKDVDLNLLMQSMMEESGWGYFLAIFIGLLLLLIWKKPKYMVKTIWKPGKPMKSGSFFALLAIFISVQLGAQLLYMLMEWGANSFGYSMAEAMESAAGSADTWSMFLYVGLGAPISEELLFRGVILRSMEPYGKKFAIFGSAVLFGLYHANLVQIPFAFVVGLVLGYVTVEYNVGWAIVLHMFNNLILSDTLTRLMEPLGLPWSELWFWVLIIGCAIAAVTILILKRREVKAWLGQYQNDPQCTRAFWTAPGILTLTIVMVLMTLVSTLLMLSPIA